jgi:hypothetical protein
VEISQVGLGQVQIFLAVLMAFRDIVVVQSVDVRQVAVGAGLVFGLLSNG